MTHKPEPSIEERARMLVEESTRTNGKSLVTFEHAAYLLSIADQCELSEERLALRASLHHVLDTANFSAADLRVLNAITVAFWVTPPGSIQTGVASQESEPKQPEGTRSYQPRKPDGSGGEVKYVARCLRDMSFDQNMQGPCSAGQCQWPNCKA